MSRRFRGEYTFKVDAKGRVSIPASFRRVIESGDPGYAEGLRPQFILVYRTEEQKFLEGYTIEEADALEERINMLPSSPLKRRLIDENIVNSYNAEVDPDGRLVLPAKLRERIGLKQEAVLTGTLNTFSIWSPEGYEAYKSEDKGDLGFGIPEGTNPLDAMEMVLSQRDGD